MDASGADLEDFTIEPMNLDEDGVIPFGKMTGGQKFAYWSYVLAAILCAVTFICLLYVTVRVVKLLGTNGDRIISAMLICLKLSILSCMIFFMVQCYLIRRPSFTSTDVKYC